MNLQSSVIKFCVIFILYCLPFYTLAQFATGLSNYTPAPGQYTNTENFGSPTAAKSLINSNKGLVSLGAFGGSITLHFSQGIKNDPLNPYGVDFVIYGNSTPNWVEPGVIQIMKDENGNNLPDDIWYEIAGSDHHFQSTNFNYKVEYKNNGLQKAGNVLWTDSNGQSGFIPENSFHLQAYYPQTSIFPNISSEKYSLEGTRLNCKVDLSNPGEVKIKRRDFGYADNTIVNSHSNKLPDNPYTAEIEGGGGDAIDIDWALDKNMNYVNLDEIHFIRIYTSMNSLAGWLGEVSTEITGIRDVEPLAINGVLSLVVIEDLNQKMKVGEKIELRAHVFDKGRKINESIIWTINNTEIASVENNIITIKKEGKFKLKASRFSNSLINSEIEIETYIQAKALITISSNTIRVNDKLQIIGKITDQNGINLTGYTPTWRTNNNYTEIQVSDGNYYIKANKVGNSWLYLETAEDKSIKDSIKINILPELESKKVYISVKSSVRTIIPRQSISTKLVELTAFVEKNQKKYGINEIPFISLAHAIYAVFNKPELINYWAFKDDADGNNSMYLWKVPELDEGSISNIYGYGGSRTSNFQKKTWVVLHNNQHYINGFENIRLNNNDEILVYHVMDNSIDWQVSQLITNTDSLRVNGDIIAEARLFNCGMNEQRNVTVKSNDIIANQNVSLSLKSNPITVQNFLTDELGKVSIVLNKPGDYEISSGIDLSKIFVTNSTNANIEIDESAPFILSPNPAKNFIKIACKKDVEYANIYNLNGSLLMNVLNNFDDIDISHLQPGFYFVVVKSDRQILKQKFLKL